jgi:hypothetical protein
MSIRWRRSRLIVGGISAAAIAIAAVPPASPPPTAATAQRAVEPTRARKTNSAPVAAQLDMVRLRRLQPATEAGRAKSMPVPPDAVANPAQSVDGPTAEPADSTKAEIVDAFASKSWYVPPPPPPPVKPEPPPKPTAPPLPFSFIGRYDDPESPSVVLLLWGDRLYTVTEGDSIDATYRVDRIERGRVELTYMPLQQKQVLQTGEPG